VLAHRDDRSDGIDVDRRYLHGHTQDLCSKRKDQMLLDRDKQARRHLGIVVAVDRRFDDHFVESIARDSHATLSPRCGDVPMARRIRTNQARRL